MTEQSQKSRRGCLFYGLIGASVLLLLLLAGVFVGYRYARKMVTDFTEPAPAQLPTARLSDEQMRQVQERIDTFREAVRRSLPAKPLALTADEINGLLATDPDLEPLKGKVHVIIEGDELKGQVSLPMDQLNLPLFHGRYLNATATFKLSFQNGIVRLSPESIIAKGKPVPEVYMEVIRKQNLAKPLNTAPRASVALDKLEDIKVADGQLIISSKQP